MTANHPLWINHTWADAGTANVGDSLVNSEGNTVTITSISQSAIGTYDLYNLHLEGSNHTYFADGVLAHNK